VTIWSPAHAAGRDHHARRAGVHDAAGERAHGGEPRADTPTIAGSRRIAR
jgi:hypothetical protein